MKFIIEYAWCAYLGFSLALFANLGLLDWETWVIAIPIILLVELRDVVNR